MAADTELGRCVAVGTMVCYKLREETVGHIAYEDARRSASLDSDAPKNLRAMAFVEHKDEDEARKEGTHMDVVVDMEADTAEEDSP